MSHPKTFTKRLHECLDICPESHKIISSKDPRIAHLLKIIKDDDKALRKYKIDHELLSAKI